MVRNQGGVGFVIRKRKGRMEGSKPQKVLADEVRKSKSVFAVFADTLVQSHMWPLCSL